MKYHFNIQLTALACLFLSSCVAIPDSPLTPQERKLVGTWTTSTWRPIPVGQVNIVAQLYPNRTSHLTYTTALGRQWTEDLRWMIRGNQLVETAGLASGAHDIRFDGTNVLGIREQQGWQRWNRYSTSPNCTSIAAAINHDQKAERDSEIAARKNRPLSEFEKFMMKPVGEIFPSSGTPAGNAFDDALQDSIKRDREREEYYRNAANARIRR